MQKLKTRKWFSTTIGIIMLLSTAGCSDPSKPQVHKTFFEGGALKSEFTFAHCKLNASSREYYKDGAVMSVSEYKDNERVGVTKLYYRDGHVKELWDYSQGTIKKYFPDGGLQAEGSIKDGPPAGDWKVDLPKSEDVQANTAI